jgi:hypothetical protein
MTVFFLAAATSLNVAVVVGTIAVLANEILAFLEVCKPMALSQSIASALAVGVVAGAGIVISVEYTNERDKVRRRIDALVEMKQVVFDPPATKLELKQVDTALRDQREWLAHWHVLPWAPTLPYADLPVDKKHRLLFDRLQ